MGYAKEHLVERLLCESYIPPIAPISSQMILNFIAEKALDLPSRIEDLSNCNEPPI